MSRKSAQTSYMFDAFAYAASGYLKHPVCDAFATQAMSVAPVGGGFGSARAEKFNFRDIVSFESAVTSVSASEQKRDDGCLVFHSRASVEVINYSVLGVIRCGRIFFNLSTKFDERANTLQHFLNGSLDDCYIAGRKVELEIAYPPREGKVISNLRDHAERPWNQGVRESGLQLYVDNFGLITLGSVRLKDEKLRVQMIQYQLGCPEDGGGEAGGGGGNGTRWP